MFTGHGYGRYYVSELRKATFPLDKIFNIFSRRREIKIRTTGIENPRCNESSLNYMLMTVTCSHYRIFSRDAADLSVSRVVPSTRRELEDRGFLFSMERDMTNEEEEEME